MYHIILTVDILVIENDKLTLWNLTHLVHPDLSNPERHKNIEYKYANVRVAQRILNQR